MGPATVALILAAGLAACLVSCPPSAEAAPAPPAPVESGSRALSESGVVGGGETQVGADGVGGAVETGGGGGKQRQRGRKGKRRRAGGKGKRGKRAKCKTAECRRERREKRKQRRRQRKERRRRRKGGKRGRRRNRKGGRRQQKKQQQPPIGPQAPAAEGPGAQPPVGAA